MLVDNNLQSEQNEGTEAQIAEVLEHHYGDGLVCLPRNKMAKLTELAQKRGFIDMEGYLTRKGRTLIARFH